MRSVNACMVCLSVCVCVSVCACASVYLCVPISADYLPLDHANTHRNEGVLAQSLCGSFFFLLQVSCIPGAEPQIDGPITDEQVRA